MTAPLDAVDLGRDDAPYASLPPAREPLVGDRTAEVVVVGGGIVGATTALRLAERGKQVVLLEARQVAGGTSGRSTGKVTSQHGPVHHRILRRHGREVAREYAAANQAAIGTIVGLVDRYDLDCRLEPVATYLHALTPRGAAELRREAQVARSLGLPATLTDDAPVPDAVVAALRFDDQRQFDPRAYVIGLVDAAERLGVDVHEHSRVRRVRTEGDGAVVHTDTGTVRTEHAVLAMLTPWPDLVGAFARAEPARSVCIAAELAGPVPRDPSLGVDGPGLSSRRVVTDGGTELLVLLASGWRPGTRDEAATMRTLADDARDRWGARRITHHWGAMDQMSADLLPLVGGLPGRDAISVATGFRKWGMTGGTVAADLLVARILGDRRRTPFSAARWPDRRGWATIASATARNGLELLRDRVPRPGRRPGSVPPGDGRVVATMTGPVAVSTDAGGRTNAVSATCTHLACTVRWNPAATAWDCACHGSRFAPDGQVLSGPATSPLPPRPVPGS